MNEKYLPIGTVVTLKDATKKVMITGYFPMSDDNKMFDYNACTYPEGVLTTDKTLAFNHEQIGEVNYMGFNDDEYKTFDKSLKEMVTNLESLKKVELPKENAASNQEANTQTSAPVQNGEG